MNIYFISFIIYSQHTDSQKSTLHGTRSATKLKRQVLNTLRACIYSLQGQHHDHLDMHEAQSPLCTEHLLEFGHRRSAPEVELAPPPPFPNQYIFLFTSYTTYLLPWQDFILNILRRLAKSFIANQRVFNSN
jgi:hypothetical protein